MIRVIIVDDQNSIREFLRVKLARELDIQVVGMADNGKRAIEQIEKHQPNIVLMDIEMPTMDGIVATEIISQRFANNTKVVLLTSKDNQKQLNLALKAGARGYILKNTSPEDVAKIIRLTEKGFFQIGPILNNWNYSEKTPESSELKYSPNSSEYSDISTSPEMHNLLSNLTSSLFQLQKTIQSQENTIVNLTNQYKQVQQEIRNRLGDKGLLNDTRSVKYKSRKAQLSLTERRQNFLFITSFLLGVLTVGVIILIITGLGIFLP